VTPVDWGILGLAVLTGISGLRRGLLASALALGGFVLGAVLGARLAPHFLNGGSTSPYTPLAGLAGAVLFAGLFQSVGSMIGSMVRGTMLAIPPLRALDSAGGLLLGAATGFGMAWVVGAVALQVPGQTEFRRLAQQSQVLQFLNELVSPRDALRAFGRVDPFPSIAGPAVPTEPLDPRVLRQPGVRAAAPSVVRILGTACGLGVEGSGWVVAPGIVVTNAHVVAGQDDTVVVPLSGRPRLSATAIVYSRRNDIAVLRVPGLRAPPLRLVDSTPGKAVAILGYPENGPFDAEPGRVGDTNAVLPRPGKQLPSLITSLAGLVRHGNSGGPAVDSTGAVQAMVFASSENSGGGYGIPAKLIREALTTATGGPVPTGECVP
jgi:S1-C subfamily serine protease